MNGFSIPGSEQAGKKVIPVDLGDCAAEKLGNFFGRGSLAGHHGEKRRKIEGVDSFQLLHRCFNLVAAKSISAVEPSLRFRPSAPTVVVTRGRPGPTGRRFFVL